LDTLLFIFQDSSDGEDKLEQLGTWQLFGVVVSMKSVKMGGCNRDSLLLSFREAKVLCGDKCSLAKGC